MTIITHKNFRSSITETDMSTVLARQINNIVPDINLVTTDDILPYVYKGMNRLFNCFSGIKNKYYKDGDDICFNHLHSDHYCSFLYLVSNAAYQDKATEIATKIFLLNKYLHGLDLYFSVQLPEIFMLVHPVGSVIGNAQYANKIVIYQNCTIGSVFKEGKYIYPRFGENVVLYSRTSVIGNCNIGDNVIFGANTFAINVTVSDNSLITGTSPDLITRPNKIIGSDFFY